MSGALHISEMRGMRHSSWPASVRVLLLCLAASLAIHALVFAFFPGWMRIPAAPPLPVLDVVFATAEPATMTVPPPQTPPQVPQRVKPDPKTVLPGVIATPERLPTEIPVAVMQPNPAAPPAFTVPVELPQPAAGTGSVPVARETVTSPALNAAYLRNPPPRYPLAARRNGDEGTVILRVLVNPEGVPVRVDLDKSSGSTPLDSAAADAVRGWRFVPARRSSQNVEGWVRVPIVFKLES